MKAGTLNHIKFHRLKRYLGLPTYKAVGVLELLWQTAANCAEDGDIGKFTDEEIADALEWDGDAPTLIRGLVEAGWLDEDEGARLVIHDWEDHCPEYIKKRLKRQREKDERQPSADSGSQCPPSADNGALTKPSQAQPYQAQPSEVCSEPDDSEPPVMEFPVRSKRQKTWVLTKAKMAEYRETYPNLDVSAEFRKALQWCRDNPGRIKTPRGMPAFLSRWLSNANDRGGGGNRGSPGPDYGAPEAGDF